MSILNKSIVEIMEVNMKGMVFLGFEQFVVEKFHLATWQKIIDDVDPESQGIYLASDFYADEELLALISSLAKLESITPADILRRFGTFVFPALYGSIANAIPEQDNLFDFLLSVDSVIHVQVKKSDPQAYTPTMFHDQPDENTLLLRYLSKRQLCHFAEGLILGAAEHYETQVIIEQPHCTHLGDKECLIKVVKK